MDGGGGGGHLGAGGLAAEERRLREAGVAITMPLRQEPWGDPKAVAAFASRRRSVALRNTT